MMIERQRSLTVATLNLGILETFCLFGEGEGSEDPWRVSSVLESLEEGPHCVIWWYLYILVMVINIRIGTYLRRWSVVEDEAVAE